MKKAKVMEKAGHWGTEGYLEKVAERFKLLGEPMRLRIIQALVEGEKTVGELVERTGGNQANISRHLHQLTQGGVLGRRKAGLHVYYRLEDEGVLGLCEHVCGSVRTQARKALEALG